MDEYESVEPSEPGPTIAPLPVDTFTLTGHMWEATAAVRGIMALHGEPMTISRIASNLPRTGPRKRGRPRADVADADLYDQLAILVRGGLVTSANSGVHPRTYYRLTPDGLASVKRAGIPKQPKAAERGPSSHAAEVARTVAESAHVTVHAMLTAPVGPATLARARLCGALHGRGWDAGAIERYFGMPHGWATTGIERWRRMQARPPEPIALPPPPKAKKTATAYVKPDGMWARRAAAKAARARGCGALAMDPDKILT